MEILFVWQDTIFLSNSKNEPEKQNILPSNFSAGLKNLDSTCPEEPFQEKNLKKPLFSNIFGQWPQKFVPLDEI